MREYSPEVCCCVCADLCMVWCKIERGRGGELTTPYSLLPSLPFSFPSSCLFFTSPSLFHPIPLLCSSSLYLPPLLPSLPFSFPSPPLLPSPISFPLSSLFLPLPSPLLHLPLYFPSLPCHLSYRWRHSGS